MMGSADVFDANTQWSGVCCRRKEKEGEEGEEGERKEKIKCS